MKKIVSLLMAVLFLLGSMTFVFADETELPKVTGIITNVTEKDVVVTLSNGNLLTLSIAADLEVPMVGTYADVYYSGDIATVLTAEAIITLSEAVLKTLEGTVSVFDASSLTIKTKKGTYATFNILSTATISGKAESLEEGQTVTVTYSELTQFMSTVYLATGIEITKAVTKKTEEDTTNKSLTGVVTSLSDSRITIKTSKGKKWTFRIGSKTGFPSSKELEVGCTVKITYDGYASNSPTAKKIKVTKTREETERGTIYKKSGTVASFEGMVITLTNGFWADLAYAKHTGKKTHEVGKKVTIYYYTYGGENYATKIKWK